MTACKEYFTMAIKITYTNAFLVLYIWRDHINFEISSGDFVLMSDS